MKRILIVLLLSSVFGACNKGGEVTQLKLDNNGDASLLYQIYNTEEDFKRKVNELASGEVAAHSLGLVPMSLFDVQHRYYIDVYQPDYALSNWGPGVFTSSYINEVSFVPVERDKSPYQLWARIKGRWLIKDKPEQSWMAVNSYHAGQQDWDDLTSEERYVRMKFKRDLSVLITTKKNGAINVDSATLTLRAGDAYEMSPAATLYFYDNPDAKHLPFHTVSMDTITFFNKQTLRSWVLVRE